MKIICTTERVIEENESCRKEYCCNKLKKAMTEMTDGHDTLTSDVETVDEKVRIRTHSSYDHDYHYEDIDYCPWCGVKLKVEHLKVDNTGLPPREPTRSASPRKRKHWWQR